jgi:DNA repair ATPase RecN
MWAKIVLIWEVVKGAASLYSKIVKAFRNWKDKKNEKRRAERREIQKQIDTIASLPPSEENDEKLVELYNKLNGIKSTD